MTLLNKPSIITATVPVLVMVLCLFAAQAVAQIDPEALDRVEVAVVAGDTGALTAAAYEAAKNGIENGMTAQEVYDQIVFLAISAASDSGQSIEGIESAVQFAVEGVNAAVKELAETRVPERDTYASAVNAIETTAEAMGLDEETVAALRNAMSRFLPEPKMPNAPALETPDIRDRSSGSPI